MARAASATGTVGITVTIGEWSIETKSENEEGADSAPSTFRVTKTRQNKSLELRF
jgi:hypothetical protein